ncbi:MAG TPA: molybdate ABC transporter substrate-binding protein [Rheinheimera sp.]|uniref:molybdate ABC transporter substrate-binding protein n=1 Tax=Rheinheimera sp. TaxID=1869214 RepID=UPI002F95708A
MRHLFFAVCLLFTLSSYAGDKLTIAAASDLRYAMADIVSLFQQQNQLDVRVIYGASGKLSTQIRHGAPYDMFFSADISFAGRLYQDGFAATAPQPYALGHLVLWSPKQNMAGIKLEQLAELAELAELDFARIAIAQPAHAPYGQRAKQALQTAGVWQKVEPKIVYGENIAQTAQLAQSGGADIAIIAQSLARFPELAGQGYQPINTELHQPLLQAYVITRHGAANTAARQFSAFMTTPQALSIMQHYGFEQGRFEQPGFEQPGFEKPEAN